MKRWALAIVVVGLWIEVTIAQVPLRVITRPKLPSQETMDRLSLTFNWHAKIPLTSPTDSIATVQVLPWGAGASIRTDIVAQTTEGWVYVFDGETGVLRWNTPVGLPGSTIYPAAANSQSIIVTRRDMFYMLDRENGVQRVYRKGLAGDRIYGVPLQGLPTAAPTATEDIVVFTFYDRVVCYVLPDFVGIANAREKSAQVLAQERTGSIQPLTLWTYADAAWNLKSPALVTPNQVVVPTPAGRVYSLSIGDVKQRLRFTFRTRGAIAAPINSHGDIAYIGGEDFNIYSLDLDFAKLLWRFPSGGPIMRRPEINDADVFVVSQGRGLFRIHRFIGVEYWLEPGAERFLAASYFKDAQDKFKLDARGRVLAKYVYAADRAGKLLVLDGDRGGLLATYDTSDWQTPVVNQWTDRLYFANYDGQILCLRPRESRTPQVNRSIVGPKKLAEAPAPPEPKKDESDREKKDDDKVAATAIEPVLSTTTTFDRPEFRRFALPPLPRPDSLPRNDRIMPSE
jgi:outer membrane protein assembly factor BamB